VRAKAKSLGIGISWGGACGLSLALAETVAGFLSGGQPAFWWSAYLVVGYVPACAVLGGLTSLLCRSSRRDPDASAAWGLALLVHGVLFAQTAVVVLQDCFPTMPFTSAPRLAAAAGAAVATLLAFSTVRAVWLVEREQGPPPHWLWPALVLVMTVVTALGGSFETGTPKTLALLFLPASSVTLSAGLAAWALRRARVQRLAAVVLLLSAPMVALLHRNSVSVAPFFLDLPQPASTELAGQKPPPNVVLVVLDTLRARNLSCYGYERSTTPNLDRFSEAAVLYAGLISTASSTLPAHFSLFTGLYPQRMRSPVVDESFETLAEVLHRAGYATAGIVSNFGSLNRSFQLDQGFRYYEAWPAGGTSFQPLLQRVRHRLPDIAPLRLVADRFSVPYRTADTITGSAQRWLADRRPTGVPYLLFLNYMDAHYPYAALEGFSERWRRPGASDELPPLELAYYARHELRSGTREITQQQAEALAARYDAAISSLDHQLGRLLGFLAHQPDYENTLIVITSDHGEALGEHRSLRHGSTVYQEQVHVPLIVRYPASMAPPVKGRDPSPAQTVDLLPTLLRAVGAPLGVVDGQPLGSGRQTVFAQAGPAVMAVNHERRWLAQAVIEDGFKYIETPDLQKQLFDLESDPFELRNVVDVNEDTAARLQARLTSWRQLGQGEGVGPAQGATDLSERQREALRALGYVR
jgi:arylsulfatase A-like enzyme